MVDLYLIVIISRSLFLYFFFILTPFEHLYPLNIYHFQYINKKFFFVLYINFSVKNVKWSHISNLLININGN